MDCVTRHALTVTTFFSPCLGAAYFSYISQLNQVVMMGTQLYHDACVPQHHKYCAHQIALLYQCLNLLQVLAADTEEIRSDFMCRKGDKLKGVRSV